MSEIDQQPSFMSAADDTPAPSAVPTAGSMLREARIAAGAHLESIAFSLKVPVHKIDALEHDDLMAFPDITFMRALASSVCRILRVDPAPVLALMPQNRPDTLGSANESARPTFRDHTRSGRSFSGVGRSSRWVMAAVFLLLLGAAAVILVPEGWKPPDVLGFASAPASGTASSAAVEISLERTVPPPALVVADPVQTAASPASFPSPSASPSLSVAPNADASESALPAEAKQSESVNLPTQAAAPDRLSLSARGDSWVKVADSNGKTLLERNLKKGEAVSVNEPGRLSVVIGRADVVDVRVGSDVRDISAVTRNNVARFEVPQ